MNGMVSVVLHIVSPSGNPGFYDADRDAHLLSTKNQIKVIKHGALYRVLIDSDTFVDMDIEALIKSIRKVFEAKMPDEKMVFAIDYHWNEATYDPDAGQKLIEVDHMLIQNQTDEFEYLTNRDQIGQIMDSMVSSGEWASDDMFDTDEEESDIDDDDPFQALLKEYDVKKAKKRRYKKYDNRSRVYRNCKNPKRDVRRHGVLVADKKRDMKSDERMIKDFLKDFIPGGASWKKDFRSELADRWISTYAVTKKRLRKLERNYRNDRQAKKSNQGTKDTMSFTRRVLTTPIDKWNDINR